jgi:hypothetical protein
MPYQTKIAKTFLAGSVAVLLISILTALPAVAGTAPSKTDPESVLC